MTSIMKLWNIFIFSIFVILMSTACSQESSPVSKLDSNVYSNKGFSISLPDNWEIIDDHNFSSSGRSISIITNIGSMFSIDIYKKSNDSGAVVIPLNQYLKKYVMAAMPTQQMRDTANIEFGEMKSGSIKGMYTDISIKDPENMSIFIEVYRNEIEPYILYFTFNTPKIEQAKIKEYIDSTIRSVKIDTALYN